MTHKTFIAAPFGNYIKPDGAISVTGTWTLAPRGNRVWSILKSLRYNKEAGGWTNKLGLPNRGIHVGLRKTLPSEVLSIAEVNKGDFLELNRIIPQDQNIELNLSILNCNHDDLKKDGTYRLFLVNPDNISTQAGFKVAAE